MDVANNPIHSIISVVPSALRYYISEAARDIPHKIQEIVLRADKPLCAYISGEQYVLTKRCTFTKETQVSDAVICCYADVLECFNNVCGYSVYSHISEIKEGFITLRGGHRVGISGTAVLSGDSIINIRDISTVSLRVSREIKGVGERYAHILYNSNGGILLCGAPVSGKTTILRDMARLISTKYGSRVSLVDTRGELAAVSRGIPQNDVGLCDVLNGYPRYEGITQALRCLSPQYIFCDEIGTNDDAEALMKGINSGVKFAASAHAYDEEELKKKPFFKSILGTGAFSNIIFLKGREAPGTIRKHIGIEELLCD